QGIWHTLRSERPHVQLVKLTLIPIEEVETAHLVRTVVGAVTGTHTTVVGHRVQALAIVYGRIDRAHTLTWSQFTMLTANRHDRHLRVFGHLEHIRLTTGKITVQTYPVHDA